MQRRRLLQAIIIPTLSSGCSTLNDGARQSQQPPAGAETVGAAFPPIGAKWKVRVTEASLFHRSTEDKDVTATQVDFNGRQAYGVADQTSTKVLNPATFNLIGTLVNGRVAVIEAPDSGLFSWPLWVGKSWATTCSLDDRLHGTAWPPAGSQTKVIAIEDVVVPAGTFRAFRLEHLGGIGSSKPGERHNQGSPGFETRDTVWYAPGPKMVVRSDVVRLGTNYRFAGWTTTELLSAPV